MACLQLDVEMAPLHPTRPIEARKEKCHLFPIYIHSRISETINNEAVHGRPDTRIVEIVITWRCTPGQLHNQRITAGYTPVARDDNHYRWGLFNVHGAHFDAKIAIIAYAPKKLGNP